MKYYYLLLHIGVHRRDSKKKIIYRLILHLHRRKKEKKKKEKKNFKDHKVVKIDWQVH